MNRSKRSRIGTLLAAVALFASPALGACGTSVGSSGDPAVFRFGYPTAASTLDPHRGAQFDIIFLKPLYDTLLNTDRDGEFVPGLATEWTLSEDGRTLDLTIRSGVRFQDGTPLDAEAVRASLERARAPESATSGDVAAISAIEVVDPAHLRLWLSEPGAHLLGALATEAGMIVSPNALHSPDLGERPVGAGPYRLASYTQGEVVYQTWRGYWNPESVRNRRVELHTFRDDSARLRAVQSGELDAAYLRPSQTEQLEAAGMRVLSRPRTVVYTLMLNTSRPGLDSPDVRRALMQGINRTAIDANLQSDGCVPTAQPFIKDYWPHVPDLDERPEARYDPERARDLLAKAGYTDDKPLRFTISSSNITMYQTLAEAIQEQFSEIGVRTELSVVETTQSTPTIRKGEFDAFITPVDVGRPDPATFVSDYYMPEGVANPGNFSVDGLAELHEKSRMSLDTARRQEPTREMFRRAFEAGPPVIPICAPDNVIGTAPGVQGLGIPPLGTYEFRSARVTD